MKRLFLIFNVAILAVMLPSCFKKEEMVTPHPMGDLKSATIPMTDTYLNQVFFSLDSGIAVRTITKTTYDLGFECGKDGWHIILNSSNFMKVADLGEVPLGQAYDTTGLALRFDKSDGNPDSTAIGEWYTVVGKDTLSKNHVYGVSRGMDEYGEPLGLYQFLMDSLKMGTYYFRFAPLSGGAIESGQIRKRENINYLYFSLKTRNVVDVEPSRLTYDLLFSQYTTLLFTDQGIPYPYLVTGVLINPHIVDVAIDSTTDFSVINREMARTFSYSKNHDVIGWEWKKYDFGTGVYTIVPNLNYVIRGISGYFYKLRFVGFYNKDGLKGYPVIEFQQL